MNRYRGGIAIILATILLFQGTGLLLLQNNNNYYAMAQSGSLYNYAPYFTATGSNFVSIPDSQELRLQQQFSVSAWFRTTMNNNSLVAIIVNKGGFQSDTPGTPQQNYGIWITGSNQGVRGKVQAGFEDANGKDYFVTSPNTYNDGQWHYAVVTYDGSTLNLYVDGSLVATRTNITAIPHTSNTPLVIGKDSNDSKRYFRGDIDEVRIYNRALTAQEVSDAYNNGVFSNNGLLISATFTPPQADNKDVSTNENTSVDVTLTASDPDNYESLTFE
ncbi:MAG: LamG domain-containing protein, partial [Candidatus Anstonellales archaeon]